LDDLVSDYRVRRVKSLGSVLSHLKPLRAHFGDWRAVGITFRAIEAYITKRRQDGKSNATINRELELLRRALRLAHDRQLLPTIPKVKTLEEQNARQGFFERRRGYLPPGVVQDVEASPQLVAERSVGSRAVDAHA
jgi:hypothetical protein